MKTTEIISSLGNQIEMLEANNSKELNKLNALKKLYVVMEDIYKKDKVEVILFRENAQMGNGQVLLGISR